MYVSAMNYYERHLGDYAKDTAHLTMIEHGAYTLLLDRYYSDESGIAAEDVYRVTRARTAAEKRAVDAALREFFIFCDGVWTHRRVEAEIKKFADKRRSSEANKVAVRLRQERAREKRKSLFLELKELGISMPWSATTEELNEAISGARSRHLSRTCHGDSHAPVTPPVTPPVTAYTIHQTPVYKDKSSNPPLPPLPVTSGHSQADQACVDAGRPGKAGRIRGGSIGGGRAVHRERMAGAVRAESRVTNTTTNEVYP